MLVESTCTIFSYASAVIKYIAGRLTSNSVKETSNFEQKVAFIIKYDNDATVNNY